MEREELARAFLEYAARGTPPKSAPGDGCALVAALGRPIAVADAEALLGALAAGADFSRCVGEAARYLAVAVAGIPGAGALLKGRLRSMVYELEALGLHAEALSLAAAGAWSGSPGLLALVTVCP